MSIRQFAHSTRPHTAYIHGIPCAYPLYLIARYSFVTKARLQYHVASWPICTCSSYDYLSKCEVLLSLTTMSPITSIPPFALPSPLLALTSIAIISIRRTAPTPPSIHIPTTSQARNRHTPRPLFVHIDFIPIHIFTRILVVAGYAGPTIWAICQSPEHLESITTAPPSNAIRTLHAATL